MKSIWSGGISFGLIYIPVNLYNATRSNELDFDMLHKKDLSPIGYAKVSKKTGEEVKGEDIVKGFQYQKGQYVIVDDEEFEQANIKRSKSVEIVSFAEVSEIDSKYFEKPYYLEPYPEAKKTYALLLEALKKSKKVGIAKFVLRNREHLAVVMPEGNHLLLMQMRFTEEILPATELDLEYKEQLNTEETKLAIDIVNKMTKKFKPESFHDSYIDELKEMIQEKALHKKITAKSSAPKATQVKDLMAQLKQSLQLAS